MTLHSNFGRIFGDAMAACGYTTHGIADAIDRDTDYVEHLLRGDFTQEDIDDDTVDQLAAYLVPTGCADPEQERYGLASRLFDSLTRHKVAMARRMHIDGPPA